MYRWNVLLFSTIHFIVFFASLNAYRDDCFINEGYICCDRTLEEMMNNVVKGSDNLMDAANTIYDNARTLRGKFETVVAFEDFAYNGLFKDGTACTVNSHGIQAFT